MSKGDTQMTKKNIVLVSKSEGSRGADGKKKIYTITVHGNRVTVSWGKAEEAKRQTQTKQFFGEWSAIQYAEEKKWAKVSKGYEIVLVA